MKAMRLPRKRGPRTALEREYAARLEELLSAVDSLGDVAAARLADRLGRLRAELVRAAARSRSSGAHAVNELAADIKRAFDDFDRDAAALFIAAQAQALHAGALVIDGVFALAVRRRAREGPAAPPSGGGSLPPVTVMDGGGGFGLPQIRVSGVVPLVPARLVNSLDALTSEEMTTLTTRFRSKMLGEVRRAALGATEEEPFRPTDAMTVIDRYLPDGEGGARLSEGFGSSAERIVRTQLNRAFNSAAAARASDMADASGMAIQKEWVATMDDRTRAAHLDADGQRVPMDEPFVVDGEELDYPGDPNGSPENTISCRCTSIPVLPDDIAA